MKIRNMLLILLILINTTPLVSISYDTYSNIPQIKNVIKPNYVENRYKFILSTEGEFAFFTVGPSLGEVGAITMTRGALRGLEEWLTARGKSTEVFDVYDEIWNHKYDLNWLHDTVVSEIINSPENGGLIMFGHASPYSLMVYRFYYSLAGVHYLLFPLEWSKESSVYVHAIDAGNDIRSKPVWEIPSLVVIIGCNSGGYNEPAYSGYTWLWAFRFNIGDFPYYWYGRGFIGFLTPIYLPNGKPSDASIFVRKVFEYAIDYGYTLGEAVEQASQDQSYSVYMDYVANWQRHQKYLSRNSNEVALFVGGYYTVVDPTLEDELIHVAIDYLMKNYPELYNTIVKYGLKPIVTEEREFEYIGYKEYKVRWVARGKVVVMVGVVSNGKEFTVISVSGRIYISPDTLSKEDALSLMNKLKKKHIEDLKVIEKYGLCSNGTIKYKDATIGFMTNTGIHSASYYFTLNNYSHLFFIYGNDFPFIKKFLKSGWEKRIKWNIGEDYAIDIALKKLKTITVFDKYNYTISRFLIVVPNGLEPVYRVLVWANGRGVKVIVDAVNGTVLYEEEFVLACASCGNSISRNPYMPDVLTIFVLTIVASIIAGIVFSRKMYR